MDRNYLTEGGYVFTYVCLSICLPLGFLVICRLRSVCQCEYVYYVDTMYMYILGTTPQLLVHVYCSIDNNIGTITGPRNSSVDVNHSLTMHQLPLLSIAPNLLSSDM